MMSTYQSDQFKLNVGRWRQPGQLAQLGNGLVWVGNGTSDDLFVYTKDMGKLLHGDTRDVKKDWRDSKLRDRGVGSGGYNLKTNYATASAVIGDDAYFFWVDTHEGTLCALRMALKTGNADFDYQLDNQFAVLYGQGPLPMRQKAVASDLSATVYQGKVLLSFAGEGQSMRTLQLSASEYDPKKAVWIADREGAIALGTEGLVYTCQHLSTDWFSMGSGMDLLMVVHYDDKQKQAFPCLLPLDAEGMPQAFPRHRIAAFDADRGVSLRRDPSGRMVALYGQRKDSNQVMSRVYRTVGLPGETDGVPLVLGSFEAETQLNDSGHTTRTSLAQCYLTGISKDGQVRLPATGGAARNFDATVAAVYQVVLYGDFDEKNSAYTVQGQVAEYGRVAFVPEVATVDPPQRGPMVLTAVMEPFPLPQGMLDAYPQVTVRTIYGTEAKDERRHQVALSTQFGIRAAFKTKSGLGPAMDFQMSAGPTVGREIRQQTSIETEFVSFAGCDARYQGGRQLVPYGELWGMSQPPILEDGLYFFDRAGHLVNGGDAPFFSQLRIDPASSATTSISQVYELFSTRQGDLSSYSEAAINQKMRAAYLSLSVEDQRRLHPGYASNYFRDIIVPHAYAFEETSKSDPEKGRYLSFHIGQGSMRETYNEIRSAMQEWGWEVNFSSYMGVSGGSSASGGIGIVNFELSGFEAEALVGFSYAGSIKDASTHTDAMRLSVDLSQVKPHHPSYEVRLYLLPSNALWAQEVSLFSPNGPGLRDKVDLAHSAPFKIFFRVIQNA